MKRIFSLLLTFGLLSSVAALSAHGLHRDQGALNATHPLKCAICYLGSSPATQGDAELTIEIPLSVEILFDIPQLREVLFSRIVFLLAPKQSPPRLL